MDINEQNVKKLKIVVLGEKGVGVKTFLKCFSEKAFKGSTIDDYYTIGLSLWVPKKRRENAIFDFLFFQVNMGPRLYSMRTMHYSGAIGAIMIFDVTRPQTLYRLNEFYNELEDTERVKLRSLLLVGNKIDLRELTKHAVTKKQGEEHARFLTEKIGFQVHYVETIALTCENTETILEMLEKDVRNLFF